MSGCTLPGLCSWARVVPAMSRDVKKNKRSYASDGYAQKTSITLKANDCTIEEVLHKIELESGFGFFVNSKNLDLKRKVSVSVSNKNIFQVLEQVFKGVGIEYKVLDNKIVLAAKEKDVAQQRKERLIAGTVKDKNGEPLIGVSIREKSSGEGTITDMDGNYKLSTSSANPVLVFSYVGYQSKEVPVKGNVANVVLEDATQELNEVVDRKSTRLNSSHTLASRMPSSA